MKIQQRYFPWDIKLVKSTKIKCPKITFPKAKLKRINDIVFFEKKAGFRILKSVKFQEQLGQSA